MESYTKNNGDNETHKYDAGYMRGKWLLEKADKLNPTAHFPQIVIAGNTFGKRRIKVA